MQPAPKTPPTLYVSGSATHDLEPCIDGRPVRNAVRWQDGAEGWAEVYAIDDFGNVDRDCFDRAKTKRVGGHVVTRRIQY